MSGYRAVPAWCLVVAAIAAGCGSPAKEEYLARGNRFAADRQYPEAIIEYRNAVQQDPKYGEARAKLADAYLAIDAAPNALREALVAAEILPGSVEAQIRAAQLLLIAGAYQEAAARADTALAKEPSNVAAHLVKAYASAGLLGFDAGIDEIDKAIELDPTDARSYTALGAIQLRKGNRAEAEVAFKRAVDLRPTLPDAYLALADFYRSTGRHLEAEPLLLRATVLDPGNIPGHRALAVFYIAAGRTKEAEAPLKTVAGTLKDVPSRLALADYYLASNRTAEGRALLDAIAQDPKGYAAATTQLAALDYAEQHAEAAHRRIDDVLRKEPANVDALLLKARFLLAEKHVDQAGLRVKAAVAANPRSATAQALLGTIDAGLGNLDSAIEALHEAIALSPESVNTRLQLADVYLSAGMSEAAIQLTEQVIVAEPAHAGAHSLLARAFLAHGDVSRADDHAKDLVKAYPNVATLHILMGNVEVAKKNSTAARREFDRALELDPGSVEALRGSIHLDIETKNLGHARTQIEDRLKKSPTHPALLALASEVYAAGGDTAQQEVVLRRLIAASPTNMSAFVGLAGIYARQGKFDQAKAEYETIGQGQPGWIGAQTLVGFILEAQNKPAEAQKVYERVIAVNPGAGIAANNLAWLYAEHGGNLDVALQLAQEAKRQMPNVPEVNDTLGSIYVKKDLADRAIPAFEASIQADPRNPLYRYHLGSAYAKVGDMVNAKEAFDAALKLKPDFREAEQAKRALTPPVK